MTFEEAWKEFSKSKLFNELSVLLKSRLEKAARDIYEQGYVSGSDMQRKLLRQRIGLSEEWDK